MTFRLPSLRRWFGGGPPEGAAPAPAALDRRRHRNLRPRPSARSPACDRRRRGRRPRHPARGQLRDRGARRSRPATPRTSPSTGSATARRRQGVPAPEALAAFRDWAADAPRVGFHADFDRAVLRSACARAGIAADDARHGSISRRSLRPLAPDASRSGKRSLDDSLAAFGIECTIRHNAAADALATAELLLRLRAMAAKQGVRGFAALVRAARAAEMAGQRGLIAQGAAARTAGRYEQRSCRQRAVHARRPRATLAHHPGTPRGNAAPHRLPHLPSRGRNGR